MTYSGAAKEVLEAGDNDPQSHCAQLSLIFLLLDILAWLLSIARVLKAPGALLATTILKGSDASVVV